MTASPPVHFVPSRAVTTVSEATDTATNTGVANSIVADSIVLRPLARLSTLLCTLAVAA